MIHLQPTVISLTMSEVKDLETRRRYRRYLQREENPTSEETVQRKSSPILEPRGPRRTVMFSQNRESSSSPNPPGVDPLPSSPLERIVDNHAEDDEPTPNAPHHGLELTLIEPEPLASLDSFDSPSPLDSPSSTGRYLSARPRRPRLFQSPSNSDKPNDVVVSYASPFEQHPSPPSANDPEATASIRHHPSVSMPSLPPPFSQKPRRISAERTWTRTLAIRSRDSLASEASPSNPGHQRRRSSCRDPIELQNDGQPGPSNPSSPQKGVKATTRLLQLCPRIGYRSPSNSHEDSLAEDGLSPDRPTLPAPGRPTSLARDIITTPRHRIRIYDDVLSPTHQPQTPEQLPEARHQSRLPGSYTAPVSRSRSSGTSGHTPVTARRLRHHRQPSPVGMRTPGFEGLYGGQENEDDGSLFEEASQAREEEYPSPSP
ncbi:hypothetical protein VP1G_05327 [Cytospora mali]|uniref:Uncharacterized protein n=1 Tax=Cytospora mali TaxID=578113 RepID=A0A194V260_CYTMA|nr:hypothetical protein VP1G_05327 [Valsa mali var. pyri (nom. inval.)]